MNGKEFEAWIMAEAAKLPRTDRKYPGGGMGPQLNGRPTITTDQQCPHYHKHRVTIEDTRALNAHLLQMVEGRTFCVIHGWVEAS